MNPRLLELHVVTPEGEFLRMPADMVEFPSMAGELGILPGHAPLLIDIGAGELRIHRHGQVECFAVAGGFVQIYPYQVRIIATFASAGDEKEIDAACQRAQQALENAATASPNLIAMELADLKRELLRLKQTRQRKKS